MSDTNSGAPWHLLERQQRFSSSRLWEMQRQYYAGRGADAWREGEVPHYVTSNPTMAHAYAEMVLAFYQDRQRIHASDQALVMCELGAGSGRFAFHFLSRLTELCAQHALPLSAFHYVLSDFTQSNLDAWRAHPRFLAWFDSGLLDMALFDMSHSDQLQLQCSGQLIDIGALHHPLVVLANYVFDGVAQDLFYFKDQVVHDCLVSLATPQDPALQDVAGQLQEVRVHYDYQALPTEPYPEALLQALLGQYQAIVREGHVYFPAVSLRCLARLKALSRNGLLLLSTDKGEHVLSRVVSPLPPVWAWHGSFSLSVNYHAFVAWCEQQGGLALTPESQHRSIAVVALLLLEAPQAHAATCRTYQQLVAGFGPDDFFTLASHMGQQPDRLGIAEILAFIRFSRFDAHQLAMLMPRLRELAATLKTGEITELKAAIDQTWSRYFPLGEATDLAFEIGCLLYELNDCRAALYYFECAETIYGQHAGTLFNRAACLQQLGQDELARPLVQQVLNSAPDHEAALSLALSLGRNNEIK